MLSQKYFDPKTIFMQFNNEGVTKLASRPIQDIYDNQIGRGKVGWSCVL